MDRLKQRQEFIEVAKGARLHRNSFSLQALRRASSDTSPRVGFTVTKKTGNAVERNRIRRRLKAAATAAGLSLSSGIDYVLIGRRAALAVDFSRLCDEIGKAARTIDPDRPGNRRPRPAANQARAT
ncbi:MAG: ribonuclease P protein component [Pseudomonadota bacterium]